MSVSSMKNGSSSRGSKDLENNGWKSGSSSFFCDAEMKVRERNTNLFWRMSNLELLSWHFLLSLVIENQERKLNLLQKYTELVMKNPSIKSLKQHSWRHKWVASIDMVFKTFWLFHGRFHRNVLNPFIWHDFKDHTFEFWRLKTRWKDVLRREESCNHANQWKEIHRHCCCSDRRKECTIEEPPDYQIHNKTTKPWPKHPLYLTYICILQTH